MDSMDRALMIIVVTVALVVAVSVTGYNLHRNTLISKADDPMAFACAVDADMPDTSPTCVLWITAK